MKPWDQVQSLRRRLAEAEENLRLVRERKSEFVQQTDVPLQLIKDERRLEQEIESLRAELARVPPQMPRLEEMPQARSRTRVWAIIAGMGLLGLVVALVTLTRACGVPPRQPALFVELHQIGRYFAGGKVWAIRATAGGMLVALDGEGVKRVGGQTLDPEDVGHLLVCPLTIAEGPDGRLWVGTRGNGLVELTGEGQVIAVHRTAGEMSIAEINVVALDGQGGVWLGTRTPGPGVHLLDADGQWHFYRWGDGKTYPVKDIALDGRELWFATDGGGLRRLNPDTGRWTAVYNRDTCAGNPICLPDDHVFAIHYVAEDRHLWVGTAKGLCVLDERGSEYAWLGCVGADALASERVTTLADDGQGHVFVGTVEGLSVIQAADESMSAIKIRPVGGSLAGYVSALALDSAQHRLWVGTLGDGLSAWSLDGNADSVP